MTMDSYQLTNQNDHDIHQSGLPKPPSRPKRFQLSRKVLFTSLFILTPLLAIASIIEIALAAEGAKRGPPTKFSTASRFTDSEGYHMILGDYPTDIFVSQDKLKYASASLSLICAVFWAGIAGYAFVHGPIGVLFVTRHVLVIVMGLNAVLSLATFLYAFVALGISEHFDLSYAFEINNLPFFPEYDKGTFDLGTWACETKDLPNFDSNGVMHTLCAVETGATCMTLFVFMLASAMFIMVYLDRRGEKRLLVTWKQRDESWDDDDY